MGHAPREKPIHLPKKLSEIRRSLGISQNEILRLLGVEDKLTREDISKYERGVREPSLITILKYAHAVGISTDALIDDKIDLPKNIKKAGRTKP